MQRNYYAEYARSGLYRDGDGDVLLMFPSKQARDTFCGHYKVIEVAGWHLRTRQEITLADARKHYWREWWVRKDRDGSGELGWFMDESDLADVPDDAYFNTQQKRLCS